MISPYFSKEIRAARAHLRASCRLKKWTKQRKDIRQKTMSYAGP
jgi:hypothetical protein